jgi:hypothetical protein
MFLLVSTQNYYKFPWEMHVTVKHLRLNLSWLNIAHSLVFSYELLAPSLLIFSCISFALIWHLYSKTASLFSIVTTSESRQIHSLFGLEMQGWYELWKFYNFATYCCSMTISCMKLHNYRDWTRPCFCPLQFLIWWYRCLSGYTWLSLEVQTRATSSFLCVP